MHSLTQDAKLAQTIKRQTRNVSVAGSKATSSAMFLVSIFIIFYSPEVWANIASTLSAKRTAFTRSAITPPKVNRFR